MTTITPTESEDNTTVPSSLNDCTIAQFIIGTKDHPKYVRLNHEQFQKVMEAYIDTDLIQNDDMQTILAVVFEDESELYHIISSPDDK